MVRFIVLPKLVSQTFTFPELSVIIYMDLKPTENRENYMHCHTCRKSVKSGRKDEK